MILQSPIPIYFHGVYDPAISNTFMIYATMHI